MDILEEFVIGRVIKAMNSSWHPNCFLCQLCDAPLADAGFIKSAGRSVAVVCFSFVALHVGRYCEVVGWWHGIAVTLRVRSTKLLCTRPG